SNTVVVPEVAATPDVPGTDVAVLEGIPAAGFPGLDEACASEPPIFEHVVMVPSDGGSGDVPDVIGLTPGEASSVAPSGTPVGATEGAGPIPSGEVKPSGGSPRPPT